MPTATETALISIKILACLGLVLANSVPTDEQATVAKASSELATPADSVAHDEQATLIAPSTNGVPKNQELVLFSRDDLTRLSRTQHDFKNVPLIKRCEIFEETLREVLKDKPVENSMNSRQVFERAIESLKARSNPYHGSEQPYVGPLRECLEQLGDKDLESLGSSPSPQRRVVVNGPETGPRVEETEKNPMEKVMEEFAEVKTRVKDPAKDLYPPSEAKTKTLEGANHEALAETDSQHDESGSGYHDDSQELPHRAMDPDVMRRVVQEEIEKEELEQKISAEQDPVKKLQMQLEREQARVKSLLEQLDANRYEIEDLLEEKERRESQAGPDGLDVSRFEMMKSMYEQASERELQTSAKLAEVERQLAEVRKGLSSKSDDDDYDRSSEHDYGKRLKNLSEMANKLQAEMSSREPLAARCQKYYMLQKYPKKVKAKVVDVLVDLALPPADLKPELLIALAKFRLSLLETDKPSDRVLRELSDCQTLRPFYPSASASASASTSATAAATASASTVPGGYYGYNRYLQNIGGHNHELHYENGPNEYYHYEVHQPTADSPSRVIQTKSKTKTSYNNGLKPIGNTFEVPVLGRDPTYGRSVFGW